MKNTGGRGLRPKNEPTEVCGIIMPTPTAASVVSHSAALARLLSTLCRERMMWTTRVCVASDSTNHPVWKSAAPA